jgi:hypothetical protein
MKLLKLLAETGIMAGGLLLVIITLSGETQRVATIISVVSVIMFIASQLISDDD